MAKVNMNYDTRGSLLHFFATKFQKSSIERHVTMVVFHLKEKKTVTEKGWILRENSRQ